MVVVKFHGSALRLGGRVLQNSLVEEKMLRIAVRFNRCCTDYGFDGRAALRPIIFGLLKGEEAQLKH